MITKPPSSLPFLTLSLYQHATCDVQGPHRLKGVKPLGTPMADGGCVAPENLILYVELKVTG